MAQRHELSLVPGEGANAPRLVEGLRTLTVPQAAEILTISPRSVWSLIAQGKLPALKITSRTTRIEASALERFIQEARSRATR
jgi:excisionase family DNA binding protein